ncbi:olfactory receptor 13A1-like [Rhinatrema bivittatum]|uniref:olfactory receptor 13A1-like n=1 Tax=Rhinatrema bivittatum TaxID=194408 RepID=UPI00112CC181|nr:olfactory receptor 13A1-like [Rhinatrema bivittatum]XP_029431406.1 olfactory receptor 13A1-like [Rhinatrema bivittatum]
MNQTLLKEIILLGLSSHPQIQILLFIIFLLMYVQALIGNVFIITVVATDHHLHTPMYFFLINLSILDIFCTSTAIPKMLEMLLSERKVISFQGCISQLFLFVSAVGTELLLLTVMACDRYVAICNPMHYKTIMSKKVCLCLAASIWVLGLVNSTIHTSLILKLSYCGPNVINHFLCEVPPILKLSCSDTYLNHIVLIACDIFFGILCFLLITVSYVYIISTIVKIRSADKKRKAFSTCVTHLTVVMLSYGSVIYTYIRPSSQDLLDQDKIISVLYAVVSPVLNPIIYSLRNKEVKEAFWKLKRKLNL